VNLTSIIPNAQTDLYEKIFAALAKRWRRRGKWRTGRIALSAPSLRHRISRIE